MSEKVRLGMVTVRMPWEYIKLGEIRPDDRTRRDVNAEIRRRAEETGAKARYLQRESKSGRLDTGRRKVDLRRQVLSGLALARALEMGQFYAQLIRTLEKTGPETKIQICQGGTPEGREGILNIDQLQELIWALEIEPQITVRALWINTGAEGEWANLVVGPAHDANDEPAPISFSHDGQQVVVEIP